MSAKSDAVEPISTILMIFILLELFEVQWQKADTLMGMLVRMYRRYRKNVLWFLVLHPTFYFSIWLAMTTELSIASIALLLLKTIDIATKIILIQAVFEKREVSKEMAAMLMTHLHPLLPYIGLLVYAPLVYLAFL
jgi:hypothetical protein